eukprot:12410346-Karenia_brevis.AAC.1
MAQEKIDKDKRSRPQGLKYKSRAEPVRDIISETIKIKIKMLRYLRPNVNSGLNIILAQIAIKSSPIVKKFVQNALKIRKSADLGQDSSRLLM